MLFFIAKINLTLLKPWKAIKYRLRRKIVRSKLDPFIASQGTAELVLDLGCANSRYARHFPNRIGIDIIQGRGVDVVGDAHHIPIKSSSFSVVLTTEMLEHVQNPQAVINEIERILKPGGKVILTTRFLFPIHEAPFDFFRFTKYGLKHLFRHWAHVEVKNDTKPFEGLGVLFQRMAFQSDFRGSKMMTFICLLTAQMLRLCDALVKAQYGDYARRVSENEIITNGYHVVAVKSLDNL